MLGLLCSWMFSGCSQSPLVDMAAPELTQRVCVSMCVTVGRCREAGQGVPAGSMMVLSLLREMSSLSLSS